MAEREEPVSVLERPVGSALEEAERIVELKFLSFNLRRLGARRVGFGDYLFSEEHSDETEEEQERQVAEWLETTSHCPPALMNKDNYLHRMWAYHFIGRPEKSIEAARKR